MAVTHEELTHAIGQCLVEQGEDEVDAGHIATGVMELVEPLGADLIAMAHAHHNTGCPGCDVDVVGVGVTHLAYAYERCDCNKADYTHLTERIWHLACLTKAAPERESTELLDDAAHVLDRYKLGKPTAERIRAFAARREATP